MGTSKTLKDFYEKNDWLSDITYGPNMNNATSPDDDIRDPREELKQNFRLLLFTIPGEINTDLQRGIGIQQFLFEFNNGATQAQISARIYQQVATYIPAITITNVTTEADPSDLSSLYLAISYYVPQIDQFDAIRLKIE
jgi:phage baseplate assembly protein W